MKAFKELTIKNSDKDVLKGILQKVITELPKDWKYRGDLVNTYAKNLSKTDDEVGCFESPSINDRKCLVWFVIWNDKLEIVNIVPTANQFFTHDEYNSFFDQFYNVCVKSRLEGYDISLTITEGVYNMLNLAGEKTYQSLDKWEKLCNRTSGNANPYDFERWADFVSAAFIEKSNLTPDLLRRWLVEERGWSDEDVVDSLVLDYEYGLSIIRHYVANY